MKMIMEALSLQLTLKRQINFVNLMLSNHTACISLKKLQEMQLTAGPWCFPGQSSERPVKRGWPVPFPSHTVEWVEVGLVWFNFKLVTGVLLPHSQVPILKSQRDIEEEKAS